MLKKTITLALSLLLFSLTASGKMTVEVAIQTPSSCEHIQITQVYADDATAVVVATVFKPSKDAMCMMMISQSTDQVILDIPQGTPVQVAIIGKGWCWKNRNANHNYIFVNRQTQLDQLIQDKVKIFHKPLSKTVYYQGIDASKHCR